MWPAGAGGILAFSSRSGVCVCVWGGGGDFKSGPEILRKGRPHHRMSSYLLRSGPGEF